MSKKLDPAQINKLLQSANRQASGQRSKKPKILDRTLTTWFSLEHAILPCENPDCPTQSSHPVNVVAQVGDMRICRVCFSNGVGEA